MYKIYWCDLGKATEKPEIGKRPVVVIGYDDQYVKVLKVTCRNREDRFHVHMNNFLVHGYCSCDVCYYIPKKYLLDFRRDCTTCEYTKINERMLALQKEHKYFEERVRK